MIMVSMRGHITLIRNLDDDLFGVDSFTLANLIRSQILRFLRRLFSIYIGNTIIFFYSLSLMQT
ncbi:Uncharacterised protein [Streptococcus pneumoniae]|nr:Uncharacterised protein [Streptococcus pneumoniae]